MTLQRRHVGIGLGLGVLVGVGATLVQWQLACRVPASEACVWGRAYLPVSLLLGAAVGLVVASAALVVIRLVQTPDAPRGQDGS